MLYFGNFICSLLLCLCFCSFLFLSLSFFLHFVTCIVLSIILKCLCRFFFKFFFYYFSKSSDYKIRCYIFYSKLLHNEFFKLCITYYIIYSLINVLNDFCVLFFFALLTFMRFFNSAVLVIMFAWFLSLFAFALISLCPFVFSPFCHACFYFSIV